MMFIPLKCKAHHQKDFFKVLHIVFPSFPGFTLWWLCYNNLWIYRIWSDSSWNMKHVFILFGGVLIHMKHWLGTAHEWHIVYHYTQHEFYDDYAMIFFNYFEFETIIHEIKTCLNFSFQMKHILQELLMVD